MDSIIKHFKHIDKIYHFIAGFVLSMTGFFYEPLVITGFLAGIIKEIYDKYHPEKHTIDIWDAFWTIVGAFIACYIIFYLK